MKKYSTLLTLYLAQSIPMSFFSTIVPVIMRQENYSLAMIGMLQLIKLPWIFKFLWAPLVDRYGNSVKNYKRWIFTSEIIYALVILSIGFFNLKFDFQLIVILMLIAFTASATQDIATDAFAILVLKRKERSLGNSMQSAGSFLGTMAGSGVLLIIYHYFGWHGLIGCLASFVLIALIPLYFYKHKQTEDHDDEEPSRPHGHWFLRKRKVVNSAPATEVKECAHGHIHKATAEVAFKPASLKDIGLFFKQKGIGRRLILLFFFYSGIIGILSLVKPFLVDQGFTIKQIGIISGICGTASGAISAVFAGFIIRRIGRKNSLMLFALLGVLTTSFFVLFLGGPIAKMTLYTAVVFLWITYGMSSVAIYTISMDIVRKGREGTDFTIQIVITHLSGILITIASGKLADILGFSGLFMIEAVLAILVLISIPFLYREKLPLQGADEQSLLHVTDALKPAAVLSNATIDEKETLPEKIIIPKTGS
jgi:MFS family permease